MEIAPIKDRTQYDHYRQEASRLVELDPAPGSTEGKALALLTLVIDEFEKNHFTFEKPSPIEAILFRMESQGLSQSDLVPFLGSRSRVSEVLGGKRPLTLTMIRNLSEGLGIPVSILIQDSTTQSDDTEDSMSTEEIEFESFPISEMVKLNWIPKTIGKIKDYPTQLIEDFLAPIGGKTALNAFWRKSSHQKVDKKVSASLLAWAGKVLSEAEKIKNVPTFRRQSITEDFKKTIARLSLLENGPLAAQEVLFKFGIILVVVPHLKGTRLDGGALLLNGRTPVIGLTLRHDRLDNFWFTLMHELIHIERHIFGDCSVFFDDLEEKAISEIEKEANSECAEALVPFSKLKRHAAFKVGTETEVRSLAEELGIHPAIVAGRIRFELRDYQMFNRLLGANQVKKLFKSA